MTRPGRTFEVRGSARIAWLLDEIDRGGTCCIDWPETWWRNDYGYPQISVAGRRRYVSHVALEIDGRVRPSGEACALHSCDRPECVAPWHLRWGTKVENNADRDARGRTNVPRGEEHHLSRLTDHDVIGIRSVKGWSAARLAPIFDISPSTIVAVRGGRAWRHVPMEEGIAS